MIVIIMAGGLGKRMESDLPKVLHKVIDPKNKSIELPMIVHIIKTSIELRVDKIFIIVGKYKQIISKVIEDYLGTYADTDTNNLIEYVNQEPALGTAHAIKCTLPSISKFADHNALILSGDVPLISISSLKGLDGSNNKIMITKLTNPFGCGRILFDFANMANIANEDKKIIGIREEKDCNEEEKKIQYVNCGIYQIKVIDLINLIPEIKNENKSNEYYLTDIVELMIKNNIQIDTFELAESNQWEIKNVNTKKDLEELNNFICNNL